jgi:23S rRNA (adenine2503-C2)-methyltransferase
MNNIVRNLQVPTGNICVMQGDKGYLEFISVGDYGKEKNLKADFLGLTNEINGVPDGKTMPLNKKWVITISTQYGCSMACKFCDVPTVGVGGNATYYDMINQIKLGLSLHPEITGTARLNIHFARMGEPTFNGNVLDVAACLHRNIYDMWEGSRTVHPVVSTMMPKNNKHLLRFLKIWTNDIKNNLYQGEAGLQISINSTNEMQRYEMFTGGALPLNDISDICRMLPNPIGRKYALNFALADDYEVDALWLQRNFSPENFMVKITPMHNTTSCQSNGIVTTGGYDQFSSYQQAEASLKAAGFDVIVFVPSYEEDLGLITYGNAILSGSLPKVSYKEMPVELSPQYDMECGCSSCET